MKPIATLNRVFVQSVFKDLCANKTSFLAYYWEMESLAVVIAVLLLIAVLAGPIAIGLSSKSLTNYLNERKLRVSNRVTFQILDALRKMIHLLLIILGTTIGSQFLILQQLPLIPRIIGLFALITSYIGFRREFFPDKFFVRDLFSRFGISRKNGRSSGKDGFGPSGQH